MLFGVAMLMVGTAMVSCASKVASLPTNGSMPVDRPFTFEVGSHCGVGQLGLPVDGRFWITDEAQGEPDWIPPEWAATQKVGANLIAVTVKLSTDRGHLTATLADRAELWRPWRAYGALHLKLNGLLPVREADAEVARCRQAA